MENENLEYKSLDKEKMKDGLYQLYMGVLSECLESLLNKICKLDGDHVLYLDHFIKDVCRLHEEIKKNLIPPLERYRGHHGKIKEKGPYGWMFNSHIKSEIIETMVGIPKSKLDLKDIKPGILTGIKKDGEL